jgi:tetratricopeptide (TPR) repeat protein
VQRPIGDAAWLDRLEREHDNLRAALDALEEDEAMRLAAALADFWAERGHVAEGLRRLERVLAARGEPTAARANALYGAAMLSGFAGDPARARLHAEQALALHREIADHWGAARSLDALGYALAEEGDWAAAQRLFEESARAFRDLGDEQYALWVTRGVAWTHVELGERGRARAIHEENLERARALGDEALTAVLLGALAMIAVDEGRVGDALGLLHENLALYRELEDPIGVAENLARCARALASAGRAATATRLLGGSEALLDDLGIALGWVWRMNEETLALVRPELGDAVVAEAREQGRALTVDEAVGLALEAIGETR